MKLKTQPSEMNKPMKTNGKVKKKKGQGKAVDNQGKKKKKEMADMSVDDMFSMIQDDDSEFEGAPPSVSKGEKKSKKSSKKKKNKPAKDAIDKATLEGMEGDDDSFEEDEEMADASNMSRKEYLAKLKQNDPEFYATMMQTADLMDLKSSDEEDEGKESEGDDDEEDVEAEGAQSQPDQEDDSDESDLEISGTKGQGGNVTSQMIAEWEEQLQGPSPVSAFLEAQQAFLAAIESLAGGRESQESSSKYIVKGSQSFNAVIRLCLKNMAPALRTMFQLKDVNHLPSKSKRWNRYKNSIKLYLRQLIALTEVVAEPSVAEAVLRSGVLPLIPFYAGYQNMSKLLARRLIAMWATSDKKVRVLAFMAIFRLTQTLHGEFLEWMLKKMYIAYVQNCRFTSPSTWGLIDFMRISLVELYCLDYARAYRHAFIYIRQMAIHLRNAILLPKKDRVQLVYNWQYIHCLNLWCDLLGKTHPNTTLQPMVFPVTQVAIGTLKLQPTPTFFPLAFHICRMLTELSRSTGTFIPVLPFLLEILNKAIFFKQPKKSSIRPFDWMCMLRLARSELKESAFKDGVVDQVYDGMVSYLSVVSSSIGFPDFVVPAVLQLKTFIKKCKSPNYCKKFKHLLDKIRENSEFVEDRRKDVKFKIADTKAVRDWEISVKQAGTPLSKYHESWRKIREREHQQRLTDSVSVGDYDLPSVKKRQLEKQRRRNKSELDDMFASDEEEDEDGLPVGARLEEEEDARLDAEEEEDNEYDDDDDEPPNKKTKKETDAEEAVNDLKATHNGVQDVVSEFNFSDLDEDEGPNDDDYGVGSNSDS